MKKLVTAFLRRGAALCLAAAVLCTAVLAAEPEKSRAELRREDLDFLYQTVLVENHPDVFANTPEAEFLALKKNIESRLETESDVEFLLDLMRLTALVGDSHTAVAVGRAAALRVYPFSMVRRGDAWYLSAAEAESGSLLCREEKPDSGDRHIKSILKRMSRMEKREQAVVAQTVNALADALEKNRQG